MPTRATASCGGAASWQLHKRRLEECQECGHQVSITAGTLFARTRKPLRLWFRVLGDFLTDKRGASALSISRRHGLSYQTAWTWLHKLRPRCRAVSAASRPTRSSRLRPE